MALVLRQVRIADTSFPNLSRFSRWPQNCASSGKTPLTASPASTASPATPASAAARMLTPRRRRRRAGWVGQGTDRRSGAWGATGRVWLGSAPRASCSWSTLALWCWSPLSLGDSTGEECVATVELCLDVSSGTSPALSGSFPALVLHACSLFSPRLPSAHTGSSSVGGWTPCPGSLFPVPGSSELDV